MSSVRLSGPGNRFYTTWKFMRDPFSCYRSWRKQYGETFLVKALNGNVVATCNPENIRRIFALPTDATKPFAAETVKPVIGSSSMFLLSGKQHKRERSLASPSFYGDRISGQAETIENVALHVATRWHAGDRINVMDVALDVSMEVIIRVVFGVQSQDRVEEFKERIRRLVGAFHPILAFTQLLQRPLFGLSPWNSFVEAKKDLDELLYEEIDQRIRQSDSSDNLLNRLLWAKKDDGGKLTHEHIRDQLVTMLMAGHETTQIAIAWTMSWLHRTPKVLTRLQGELSTQNGLQEILSNRYLEAIVNESLRLNAIVPDTVRTLTKPLELVETKLPSGTNLAVAICLVHEDPELYPEPFQFNPDRWAGITRKPYEFLPFGGGVRRCIGATLAMLEIKMTVATWIRNFEFRLPEDAPDSEPIYRRNITMAPRSGIPLIFMGQRLEQANQQDLTSRSQTGCHPDERSACP